MGKIKNKGNKTNYSKAVVKRNVNLSSAPAQSGTENAEVGQSTDLNQQYPSLKD